eukprot:1173086-Amphidinium_carterae.1
MTRTRTTSKDETLEFIVDSGASVTAIPPEVARNVAIDLGSDMNRKSFTSASKTSLKSLGTKTLTVTIAPRQQTRVCCEVLRVHKPLLS